MPQDIGARGLILVSGLARGIDRALMTEHKMTGQLSRSRHSCLYPIVANHLIRTGAALIETVDDIMEALRPLIENMALKTPDQKTPKRRPSPPAPVSDAMRGKITEFGAGARIDDLVEQAEAPLQSVHLVLLELELAGRLTYDSGGQVCLDIND